MSVYYILLFFCISIGFISYLMEQKYPNNKDIPRTVFLIFSWIAMSLIEGLRAYFVGTDTPAYTAMFAYNFSHDYEIGFAYLVKFLHLFSYNPTVYLLTCAALANGLVLHAIKKFSVNPYLSVYFFITLFYYFGSFNGVRQYIAIGFVLHAFIYAVQHKKLLFFLNIALAMCFHNTAIVGLCFIWYLVDKRTFAESANNSYLREFALLLVAVFTILAISSKLNSIINGVTGIFKSYEYYLHTDYLVKQGGIQQIIVYLSVLISFSCFIPPKYAMKKILLYPLYIAVLFSILQMKIILLARILWYFDIFTIFAIPYLITNNRIRGNYQKYLLDIIIVSASFSFMSYYLYLNYQKVGNYQFVWSM